MKSLWRKRSVTSPTSQLILQLFRRFTYVTAHSPTLPLLHLRHDSFSNPYFAFPTSQALLILQPFRHFTYVTTHSPTLPSLYLRHSSFFNPFVASRTSQFILQPFFRFSYITSSAHSPNFPSLYLRHNSFYNPSVAISTSQLISNPSIASPKSHFVLQPLFRFSYITSSAHSPTFPSLHVRHNHSPTLQSLYLRHSSFSNPSVAWPTSQFILQPFFPFSYVTSSSLNSHGEPPMF